MRVDATGIGHKSRLVSTTHGFPSARCFFILILLKIPSKKKKFVSGDIFVVCYPFALRFLWLAVGGFLFGFSGLLCTNDSICGSIHGITDS